MLVQLQLNDVNAPVVVVIWCDSDAAQQGVAPGPKIVFRAAEGVVGFPCQLQRDNGPAPPHTDKARKGSFISKVILPAQQRLLQ